jgi:hypothetical protein
VSFTLSLLMSVPPNVAQLGCCALARHAEPNCDTQYAQLGVATHWLQSAI